ncbi:hypothetical protein [Chitinophaga sp.]|uniref:hypothetical protein n=1 Tax=Chitinophaga sp. TaxID=1869181 RepID=UPI002F925E96
MRFLKIACLVLICGFPATAQQDSFSSRLLHEIAREQVASDSFYFAGMFPSQRYYGRPNGKMKQDNNIFFTGLIAMTLGEIQYQFTGADSVLCRQIRSKACATFPNFRHQSGRATFNFWRTNPSMVFPNSRFLNLFRKWHSLPDDIDDTAILLLAMQADSTMAYQAKLLMQQHANTVHYRIRNTFKKYRQIPAYSTWFGKSMPIDFDACVLTNALYFMHAYNMANSSADSATVQLLDSFIRHREYMSHAAYISPHYARPAVLLYHMARLIGRYPIPALAQHRSQLVTDMRQLLAISTNDMDRIILSTALIWLGDTPPETSLVNVKTDGRFVFFVAGFNSLLPDIGKKMLSGFPPISYYYQCPAYNKLLLLQHYLLRKERLNHRE